MFALPVAFFLMLVTAGKKNFKTMLLAAFTSLIIIIFTFFLIIKTLRINFAQIKMYFFTLSVQVGLERLEFFTSKYPFPKILKCFFYPSPLEKFSLKLFSFALIYLSALLALAIWAPPFSKLFPLSQRLNKKSSLAKMMLSIALIVICNLFVMLTLNQGENGIPYLFVSLGIMHIIWTGIIGVWRIRKNPLAWKYTFTALFMLVAAWDALSFNNNVNRTRMVHDFKLNPGFRKSSQNLPPGLGFIDFAMPPHYTYSPESLKKVIEFFKNRRINFFLIGDTSIIYGLAGRPSINPCLWFHPGFAMPALDSDDFHVYEERLLENIRKYKVKYIVLEGNRTWFNVSLNHFHKLASLVRKDSVQNRNFGRFRLLRLKIQPSFARPVQEPAKNAVGNRDK